MIKVGLITLENYDNCHIKKEVGVLTLRHKQLI